MFWWIVLGIIVTFGAAILPKVTRISNFSGALLAAPLTWLLFGFKENETNEGGDRHLRQPVHCVRLLFCGAPHGQPHPSSSHTDWSYWLLCFPVAGITLMIQFILAKHPIPTERASGLYMEAWPNLVGSVTAIVACYLVTGQWFK